MQSLAESSHINAELFKETTYMIKRFVETFSLDAESFLITTLD